MAANPLLQVSLDLAATLTAEDRYRRLLASVRQMIPADSVMISRLAPAGLHPVAFEGLRPEVHDQAIPVDHGPHAALLTTDRPLRRKRMDDTEMPSVAYAMSADRKAGVWMGVPLRVEGDTVGTLAMTAVDAGAFDDVSDETVMAFAGLAAASLRTVWLLDSLQAERDQLQEHVAFEALVLSISARFIHLPPEDIQRGIDEALKQIGQFAGVDRSYIFVSDNGHSQSDVGAQSLLRMLHEWCADGVDPSVKVLNRLPADDEVPREAKTWMMDRIVRDEVIRVDDIADLPGDAMAVQERWRLQGCKSVLIVPLEFGSRAFGLVGFDSVREYKSWSDETVKLLRTVGYILASAIERKRSVEALQAARDGLETMVQDRTRDLQEKQAQLAHSEKMASLGQLVAGIAHEVNTPLGAINSNNDTLQRTLTRLRDLASAGAAGAAKMTKFLDVAENLVQVSTDATRRIIKIVGSLRNFARLDQAEVEQVDLHEGIESTLVLVNHKLKRRVKVHRDFGDIPPVECHADQINQVFMNLFVNAVQAIEGKGELFIRTWADHGQVHFSIRDTGCGIDPDNLKRVFDPGFTTKGVGVGTGLGLAIVHQIVDEHRGVLSVDSQVGRGTTVSVSLPATHPQHHGH